MSFDISSSYQDSLNSTILILLTNSPQLTPIGQLRSSSSQQISQKILFPKSGNSNAVEAFENESIDHEILLLPKASKIRRKLPFEEVMRSQQIFQSFLMGTDQQGKSCLKVEESLFVTEENDFERLRCLEERNDSSLRKHENEKREESRIIYSWSNLHALEFEEKLSVLSHNVNQLGRIIHRICDQDNPEGLQKHDLYERSCKSSQTTRCSKVFSSLNAKSAARDKIEISPIVSSFSEKDLLDINQLSPISKISTSEEKEFNTSETSSRSLMRKKMRQNQILQTSLRTA